MQLALQNTKIKWQPTSSQKLHVIPETDRLRQFIRLRVQHTADTEQFGVCDRVEIIFESIRLRPACCDHSQQPVCGIFSKLAEKASLRDGIFRRHIHFHEYAARTPALRWGRPDN